MSFRPILTVIFCLALQFIGPATAAQSLLCDLAIGGVVRGGLRALGFTPMQENTPILQQDIAQQPQSDVELFRTWNSRELQHLRDCAAAGHGSSYNGYTANGIAFVLEHAPWKSLTNAQMRTILRISDERAFSELPTQLLSLRIRRSYSGQAVDLWNRILPDFQI